MFNCIKNCLFVLFDKKKQMTNPERNRTQSEHSTCHDPLPVGIFLAAEESQNSQEGEDTEELRSVK